MALRCCQLGELPHQKPTPNGIRCLIKNPLEIESVLYLVDRTGGDDQANDEGEAGGGNIAEWRSGSRKLGW